MTPPPMLEDQVLPPTAPATIRLGFGAAFALVALPAILGLVELGGTDFPPVVSTLRLVLAGAAALTAAGTLTLAAGRWGAWLAAAGVALAARFALPTHWDSFRMVARVLTVLAAAGGGLAALAPTVRFAVLSAGAMVHFGALLVATTWPDPSPWITGQLAGRFYMPYYRFMYLSNAYHFYSPEPGPANHLFVLIKFKVPDSDTPNYAWVDIPNRQDHYKDPLGLTYYRRLSLTELVSLAPPATMTPTNIAKFNAGEERKKVAAVSPDPAKKPVPLRAENGPIEMQYRVSVSGLRAQTLPSYARHIAVEYAQPGKDVVSVKMFRVEHQVIPAGLFLPHKLQDGSPEPGLDPFHPSFYKPYYLGEYDKDGTLLDPNDPLLYWLLPIERRAPLNPSDPPPYEDYMSNYAGYPFPWPQPAGKP